MNLELTRFYLGENVSKNTNIGTDEKALYFQPETQ